MKGWWILTVALLVGAAAPARAWCEATCLAPAHDSDSERHCPSHEESSDRAVMSAAATADCPAVDAARPIQAKLDLTLAPIAVATRTPAAQRAGSPAPVHLSTRAPSHLLSVPLRV